LYKLLKIKRGLYFGQRDCLTSIISGIDKGHWGKQRNPDVKRESGPIADFATGNSNNSREIPRVIATMITPTTHSFSLTAVHMRED
jgi:hypothetical protein